MSKLCAKYITQFQTIQTLQTKLTQEVKNFSDSQSSDRKEQSDDLIKIFNLRKLIKETIKEINKVSVAEARDIMGDKNFFGPEEIKFAFNFEQEIDPSQIPEIGFTLEELERAAKLKHFLILRIDKANDGEPLTMKKIIDLKDNKTKTDNGKLLYETITYQKEDFFIKEPLKLSWALVTREVVPGTTDKRYLSQYDVLITYLKEQVLQGQEIPQGLQKAIEDFNQQRSDIDRIAFDRPKVAEALENLKITKLLRRTPAEIIYDLVITFDGKQSNSQKLLSSTYDWSSRCSNGGWLISVSGINAAGAYVHSYSLNDNNNSLGSCLSRRSIDIQ